ncbi:dehydrogenase/reductase SDR family member 12 isoform X2 [Carettochelys insculpta]|uniref:dehydrogenase/reductase SDR family member 12 isoform X2 n=1 Tax=Carettochelys insculpta TaxID=44489 RepID=UPI003EB77FC5
MCIQTLCSRRLGGGTLHLVCRNKERAEEAKREIITETGNENIFLHILDMSNPKGIWEFAEKFKTEHKLNVLINNAGCMVNKRELTEDGLEKNFATNTLGTYILTTALLPLLEKEDDPRVIIVSSGGMLVQKLDVSDLQSTNVTFDGTMVYAQNKRQQVVLTEQWAKVHKNIHFSVMHPGWADTPAVRSAMPEFYERMKNKLRTEAQGADTVVWLAISSAATKQTSGLFFQETVSRLQREISELQFICKFDALSSGLNKDCEWLAKYRSSFPSLGIHTSRSTAGNRQPVSTHLPLARTYSSPAEEEKLMEALEQLSQQFKPARSLLL